MWNSQAQWDNATPDDDDRSWEERFPHPDDYDGPDTIEERDGLR